jgi:PleD family two-component response regulator
MKILIVDRDRLAAQMINTRLTALGHQVAEETVKNDAIELISREEFDTILIDPAPLTNPRPIILGIRRSINHYPYVMLISHEATQDEAIRAGTNDILLKPVDNENLDKKMENAQRLTDLIKRIGDESEDFPSAGGVIAKSAFNQLFLSAIDRADRYGEKTFVLFISISNYQEIYETDGPYASDFTVAKMCQNLVRLRRQSDIIGQTAKNEYALLLQRPQYETEPVEAANRFAEALLKTDDIVSSGATDPRITIELVDLPVGERHIVHVLGEENHLSGRV